MKLSHKITNVSGEDIIYIYVTVEDIYEFGKENLGKGENTSFLTKLRDYITNNIESTKKATAMIVINGVIVGSLTLAALYPTSQTEKVPKQNANQVIVYEESDDKIKDKKEETLIQENVTEGTDTKKQETKQDIAVNTKQEISNNTTNKENNNTKTNTANLNKITATNKTGSTSTTEKKQPTSNVSTTTTPKTTTNKSQTAASGEQTTSQNTATENITAPDKSATNKDSTNANTTITTTTVSSGVKIKFNNNGIISNIDLEEYVIGVVAAEMPAAFHTEALKAQAVVARTYAMKKASKGITLVNSTSHQVYNSIEQMKAKWGSSYSNYYNKIRNAVSATKGKVLKYNGEYIEALYFSISNGKTELPTYVWSTNYPYLQVVSSSWDSNISAGTYTTTISYAKLSSKLGVNVNKSSDIKILSRTAGDRVNEIDINGKIFTGVKIRSLLGLRSADFTITKTDSGVSITTKGFGHGVGMSQYGANGAAKAGYTYKQILNHYYYGASLVNI